MKLTIIDPVIGTSEKVITSDVAYIKQYLHGSTEIVFECLTSGTTNAGKIILL